MKNWFYPIWFCRSLFLVITYVFAVFVAIPLFPPILEEFGRIIQKAYSKILNFKQKDKTSNSSTENIYSGRSLEETKFSNENTSSINLDELDVDIYMDWAEIDNS